MVYVRSVVERRQIANQPDAANRPPAHVFDETVINLGLRSDHHSATGEFAVAERQEQAEAAIAVFFSIDGKRKRATAKTQERKENSELITELPPSAESPCANGGQVCRKSDAKQIKVVKDAVL